MKLLVTNDSWARHRGIQAGCKRLEVYSRVWSGRDDRLVDSRGCIVGHACRGGGWFLNHLLRNLRQSRYEEDQMWPNCSVVGSARKPRRKDPLHRHRHPLAKLFYITDLRSRETQI
jgi:hypothetical protein